MWTLTDSPVGVLRVVEQDDALTAIEFSGRDVPDASPGAGERDDAHPLLVEATDQLAAYFARELAAFDLPLAPGGTDFQQAVWKELRLIGWGETTSYGDLAHRLGHTSAAARAVGLANGRNPLPIVVPCHRVVGADGSLTGYAGGVERKRFLLDLEQGTLL